jgi:hypothetical protein
VAREWAKDNAFRQPVGAQRRQAGNAPFTTKTAKSAKKNRLDGLKSRLLCLAIRWRQSFSERFFTTDFTDATDKNQQVFHPWHP